MNVCKDCNRYTKKGYKLRGELRCDSCWADYQRRDLRANFSQSSAIRHSTRKPGHLHVDP